MTQGEKNPQIKPIVEKPKSGRFVPFGMPKGKVMKKPLNRICLMLGCLVLMVSHALAGSEVTTNFVQGMELTKEELNIVLSLAQKVGVTNVVSVSTGHICHSIIRGVFVTEGETVADGKIRYRSLFIKRRQWMRENEKVDEKATQLGDFWIHSTQQFELTLLNIDGKEYKLTLAPDIPVATAEAILKKLLKRDYNLKEMEKRAESESYARYEIESLKRMDTEKPFSLNYDADKGVYRASFLGEGLGGPTYYLTFRYTWRRITMINCNSLQM